jgi:hypothetical protein
VSGRSAPAARGRTSANAAARRAGSYLLRAAAEDGFEDVAYSETSLVYQALEDFPVAGQAGLVVGSIMPWAEAILFAAGARCTPWPPAPCK